MTDTISQDTGKPALALLIAAPRGFCAGVDRAIRIVELAIEKHGARVSECRQHATGSATLRG